MKKTVIFSLIFSTVFFAYLLAGTVLEKNKTNTIPNIKTPANIATGDESTQVTLDINEVAKHNSKNDCWVIFDTNIYDVTNYFGQHPGGDDEILPFCGQDLSTAFKEQEHSEFANNLLANYFIGSLNSILNDSMENSNVVTTKIPVQINQANTTDNNEIAKQTSNPTKLSLEEVAKHSTQADCWTIYSNKVLNITNYFGQHPGGNDRLLPYCGKDLTQAFNSQGHSSFAISLTDNYFIGNLNSTADSTAVSKTPATNSTSQSSSESLQELYPGANIIKENIEDDGRKEIKFTYNGKTYEAKLDANGNITEVDDD